MTMRELARLANVSISTVSKAFGDADDICDETKERIFALAKQYGCYGKYYKGKFSKKVFAIICSELISDFYIGFVERLQATIEENSGIAVISADHFSTKKQAELIEYYASYLRVDGIVVFGLRSPVKKGYDIPIVSIFSTIDAKVDSVNVNMTGAMEDAVDLLYRKGHRDVAFLGEPLTIGKARLFEEVCAKYSDLQTRVFESANRFEQAGKDGVKMLLKSEHLPSALVCAYDNIAIGAMKALKKAGLSVPKDISIIGADNIESAEYTEVPLTTIDSASDEVCAVVWELLLKKQENKYYRSNRDITIKARLIERDSVGEVL